MKTISIKVVPDREGCVYRTGETATLEVSAALANGTKASEGFLHLRLDNFGERIFEERDVDLSKENPFLVAVSRTTPGFARLTVEYRSPEIAVASNPGNSDNAFRFGIAFSPEEIRPATPCPGDFADFWKDAVSRLDETVPVDAQVELVPERSNGPCNYWRVSFASYGGRRVYGWLSIPKAKVPHPVRVSVPGSGIGACETPVEPDRITLTMNVHSYRQHEGNTPEADAERQRLFNEQIEKYCKPNGVSRYSLAGIHRSREDYFYYSSILGINRAINWLAARPECDHSSFCYTGASQGGGFGLILTALNRHFTSSCVFVPAMADLLGSRTEARQSGWPSIVENQAPENRSGTERWAPYFDGANFARLITCPIRFVVGFCDIVCPPHSGYSAYNVCASSDKAIIHGIGMGHAVFDCLYRELDDWQRLSFPDTADGDARLRAVASVFGKDDVETI